jgi:hypothetical protein
MSCDSAAAAGAPAAVANAPTFISCKCLSGTVCAAAPHWPTSPHRTTHVMCMFKILSLPQAHATIITSGDT